MSYSAIIRTKNPGALFRECLDSLNAQTQPPGEVIVVDSGSEKDFLEEVEETGCKLVHYRHEGIFFPGKAVNLGVEIANFPVVCIISPHCEIISPKTAEQAMNELDKDSKIVSIRINPIEPTLNSEASPEFRYDIYDASNYTTGLADFPCTWLRTKPLRDNPLSETMVLNEDQFWLYDRIQEGCKFLYDRDVKYYYKNRNYNVWKRYQGLLTTDAILFPQTMTWRRAWNAFRSMGWYVRHGRRRGAWEQGIDFLAIVRFKLFGHLKKRKPLTYK